RSAPRCGAPPRFLWAPPGFEVRNDVEYGGMHWIPVGPAGQPDTAIVLYPPAATPGITEDERRTIAEMMAKGTYASINLATKPLDATFERLQAGDAEVVQEPTEQPYGIRDCAFRDPAGNLVRIQELRWRYRLRRRFRDCLDRGSGVVAGR